MKKKLLSFFALTAIAILAFAATQVSRRAVGTEIWSSDPATALEWGEANITVAAEKFADAKVGDILHVNLTDVKTGASNPWEAQVELRSTNWKTLTDAVNIAGTSTSEPVTDAAFVLTGDIVKILKSLGAQFNGTGGKVSSITLESVAAATGSDKSIWNGSVTEGNITVSLRHLANARNFNGIKAGDKIRVTFDKTSWVSGTSGWIGVQYVKGSGWTWTEIAGETHPETTVDNKWNGDPVEITINTDALAAELNDFENNHGLIIQTGKNTTATQIELLPMYSVNINPEITNGKLSVDKPTATDGDEVTITAVPDDGYMLDAISVTGVTSDLAVPVKDGKFTMPADDVTVNATFKVAPVDVAVAAGDINGGDITAAIAAKAAGKPIKDLTLTLTAGAYTVSAPIIAAGSIVVNGATGATIDASALTAPFIALSAEPTAAFLPKNDGSGVTDYYGIDKVDINNVKVTGLKQSIFWDSNKKYCVVDFKIDNCVFALATEAVQNEALIAFQAGGAKDFTVKNSTIYGNNAVAKYFLRYNNSARIDRYGFVQAADTWSFTYENNTFYGLLKSDGQWGNYNGLTQKTSQFVLAINNNIWVDCDAQTMRRLNHSKNFSAFNAASTMANNVFNREGAVVDQGTYGNGSDINGVITFADAANGIFNGTLGTETAPTTETTAVGDTEWTITNKQVPANIVISPAEGDITAALATAAEGKIVGNVTINLTADAKYTVSGSIVAGGSVVINGAAGAVIDASALTAPFIALSAEPTAAFLPKNDGSGVTDYYGIDKVDINNVKVTGLKQSIFWDSNKKYCVVDFKIDNCVFALATEAVQNDALIAFQAGGAKDFAVKNSTISGNNAVAKYFVRYNNSARIDRYGFVQETDTWSFTYENNTFYGLLKSDGQWGNYSGITGKKTQGIITVNNNIWVDCDAQTMRRMLNSQAFSGFNAASAMANNVFNREGAVVDQANYGNGSDINGRVNFAKAAESKFDFTLVTAPGTTAPASVGDQRWAMTTAVGYATTVGECTGGTVKADKPYAAAGEKVYATFTPAEGYSSSGIVPTVKNDAGEDVTKDITFGEDETGKYFVMPAFNITVSVVFQPLPKFYIIGGEKEWKLDDMTEMTYNKETDKYEYEIAPTTTIYFAFSDKQFTAEEAAAADAWDTFNSTNRYSLGAGNVDATLNEIKSLTKGVEGTIVLKKVKEGTSYKISVEKDFNAVTITGEAAPILPYVVAGSSTELFGTAWAAAAEANAMKLNETTGKYEITYSNVTLSAGDIEYKIVKDGSTWIPDGENKKLNIPAAGTYNVTFTFNPETNEITGAATDATGINGITVDGVSGDIFSDGKPVYNLSGQRVFKGYKGIVIKNGRKIVVK